MGGPAAQAKRGTGSGTCPKSGTGRRAIGATGPRRPPPGGAT